MNDSTSPVRQKVLLVDDQVLSRISLARLLQHYTLLDITATGTGEGAIAHLNGALFDLCIFDIGLPDISGLLLLKLVRELSLQAPVIITTGDAVDESILSAVAVGGAELILKPFEIAPFVDRVLELLQRCYEAETSPARPALTPRAKRRWERTPLRQTVEFSWCRHTVEGGESGEELAKRQFSADTVDISTDGIGLRTSSPLARNQIVLMSDPQTTRAGVVKWCAQVDDTTHGLGLKLI